MDSLRITFDKLNGWTLHPDELVSGFEEIVQCALVLSTTQRGTIETFPVAGTNLLQQGALGLLLDLSSARHACNFAAAETKEFVNNAVADNTLNIDQFNMQPVTLANGELQLELRLVSTTGVVYGLLLTN
jgi:hypothetical protein